MSDPISYLELVRKLAREVELTSSAAIPTDVTTQTGQLLRMVEWVRDAYSDIQLRHDAWRWMRKSFTLTTTPSDGTYESGDAIDDETGLPISRFRFWWAHDQSNPFKCYLQSSGIGTQYWLSWLCWEDFNYLYNIGTQNPSMPAHVSVDNDDNLRIGPKPLGVCVVTGDYQRDNQILTAAADEPEMPTDYHGLIWRWAMKKYGANSVAAEIYARADDEATRTMRALERRQLPMIGLAAPLA